MGGQVSLINGAEIFWEAEGEGPVIVLIHAAVADSRMWDGPFERLSQDFRCIRYDMRGFGRSSFPPGPFSHLADLEALLETAGADRVSLVGASMGGRLAIDFSLAHPTRASRLVLVAPALGGHEWSQEVEVLGDEEDAALEAGDIDGAVELNLKLWVDGPRRDPKAVSPAVRASVAEMQRNAFVKLVAAYEQTSPPEPVGDLQPPAVERLGEIQVPTLVLVGDEDVSDIADIAERLSQEMPRARKVVMRDTAHMLTLEKPEEFAEHLLRFLQEPD